MTFYDDPNDQPQLGSISIKIYPAVASANVAPKGAITRSVVSTVQPSVPASFSGPLQPTYVASTTTTGPTTNVKTGSFSSQPIVVDRFLSYEYAQDFLCPVDPWSFTVPVDSLSDAYRQALAPGAKAEISIDGQIQTVGYIDGIKVRSNREGGSVMTVDGRCWLSAAVDAHIDPQVKFTPSMTLVDVLNACFGPFGMSVLATDNAANRNATTGGIRGVPTTKKGKELNSYKLHELQPYQAEGAFAFASRVSQRFGLWLWPSVDGKTVICGQPDYDQAPKYTLSHKLDPALALFNNVLESETSNSRVSQPSIIFASGTGGGADFACSTLRGAIINPLVAQSDPNVIAKLMSAYPGIIAEIAPSVFGGGLASIIAEPNARPAYLRDNESHTPDELRAFLRRELSIRMRKGLQGKYTVEGHKLNGSIVTMDTIATVDDDRSDLHLDMWVCGRRFSKRPDCGTRTTLDLIRPFSLSF